MTSTQVMLRKAARHRGLPAPALRRAIRQDAGLSQQDIAEVVGVTRESVSRWETGNRRPVGGHLEAYAELLRKLQKGWAQ
jgi:transcriptional regulator with XRE-family HTH domain